MLPVKTKYFLKMTNTHIWNYIPPTGSKW